MIVQCGVQFFANRCCNRLGLLHSASNMNATMAWLTLVKRQPSEWPSKWLTRASCHLGASFLVFSQCCECVFKWCALRHQTRLLCVQCADVPVKAKLRHQLRPNYNIWFSIVFVLMLTSAELVSACGPGRRFTKVAHRRKLTPLVFKQHIPNVSENTLGASGLSEGRVSRHHKRFKELVPNYNADIIFRDDEGTGADRLMTQRLKEKLNTLAISVMNQWPGVKLRVTQSWHEGNQYAGESLHYEGRAVDITTNDRDRSKLGMLARLAVEAGFDWVYYESRVWIHCSVKSEKSESARNGGCFDENSVVYDRHGSKLIKDVQVGDEILSMNSDGNYKYSEVLMFLDRDPNIERLYYHIETESGASITTTPSHLLFVAENNSIAEHQLLSIPQFAKDIYVGQYLFTRNGSYESNDGALMLDRVVRIRTSLSKGAFAPLTMSGTIVVNNITASCYAVIGSQTVAHLSFLPVRWAHFAVQLGDHLSGYFLSKSTSTYSARSSAIVTNGPVTQVGVHWYAQMLYNVFKYLIPSRMMFN